MGSSSSLGGTVRIGVIGAGGICNSVHLPSLFEMPDVQVVAICDLVKKKADSTAAKWGIPNSYALMREMFAAEKLDAVFCLVEPGSLFHVAMLSLQHGYPVFCEKPPCITFTQAEALARLSDKTGKPVMIGFNRRFIPVVRETKKQFLKIHPPTQVEGCFYKFGAGDCFDLGGISAFTSDTIHALDLLRFLSGGNRARKSALLGYSRECTMENQWNGILEFDNGVAGIINANYMAGGRIHNFQMHGPGVSALINLGFGAAAVEATLLNHTGGISYSLASTGGVTEEIQHLEGKELAGSEQFHKYYGYFFEDRHFIDCLKSGQMPESCIQDAKESLYLTEQLLAARI